MKQTGLLAGIYSSHLLRSTVIGLAYGATNARNNINRTPGTYATDVSIRRGADDAREMLARGS